MLLLNKLKELGNDFKKHSNSKELKNLLQHIKQSPGSVATDFEEVFLLIINLFCYKDTTSSYDQVFWLRNTILDILISSIDFSDLAWYLIDRMDIESILYDEFYNEIDSSLRIKILKCIELYLLFVDFENKLFHQCQDFCCQETNSKVPLSKVLDICESIVKSLIKMEHENLENKEGIDNYLITLSLLYRRYSIDLSPESCGDTTNFKLFKNFLFDVCQSEKYSAVSAISAFSCFYNNTDKKLVKGFTETNSRMMIKLIYDSLTKVKINSQSSSCLYATLLLNDLLLNENIMDLIRREWTVNHYKSICKLFIFEFPPIHYEKMLHLFCTLKSTIPEWDEIVNNYLASNSKLFEFMNSLTGNRCDRSAILTWRLFQSYFQSSEMNNNFIGDYCLLLSTSVKSNLDMVKKSIVTSKVINESSSSTLANRNLMRVMNRASTALNMLIKMMNCSNFIQHVAHFCSASELIPFIETLVNDLINGRHDYFTFDESDNIKAYGDSRSHVINPMCESSGWLMAAACLTVSLVYFSITMATNFPTSFCRKNLNLILKEKSFVKLLVMCMTRSSCTEIVERSVTLMTASCQSADYDLTALSNLICNNTKLIFKNIHNHVKQNIQIYSTSSSAPAMDSDSQKHRNTVRSIVNSYISDTSKSLSQSEVILMFGEELKNLEEQRMVLENFVKEKDDYIRHCNGLVNDYRLRAQNCENRFNRLVQNHASAHQTLDDQNRNIKNLNDQLTEHKKIIETKDLELSNKLEEIDRYATKLQEMEQLYHKEIEKVNEIQKSKDNLEDLVARLRAELDEKNIGIDNLEKIKRFVSNLNSGSSKGISICSDIGI